MIRSPVVIAALALAATAVLAQSDPIKQRQELMKANGAASRLGTQMIRGEVPFDPAKAKQIMQTFAKTADEAHNYFPENSKTGGNTEALPKIWENQADFRKRFDDWAADIKRVSNKTDDLASFKEAFGSVTKACGSCHETYRMKKS